MSQLYDPTATVPGSVFIDISGYCAARDSRNRDYILFIIRIRLDRFLWIVYRRYSAFKALSDELRKTIPGSPPCPPKRVFESHTPYFLEQRRVELLDWIRQLACDERVCRNPLFHEFLRSHANMPPAGLLHPSQSPLLADMYSHYQQFVQTSHPPAGPDQEMENPPAATMQTSDQQPLHSSTRTDASRSAPSNGKVGLKDFALLKVIGKGSFGKVMQVKKKDNGRIYAMKVLHKANIVRRNQVEHTRTERNVLGRIVHPFIVGLNYAFQTPDRLYFVLDYCAGGELFFHLGKEGKFSEDRSRFYTAQLVLALEHLHNLDVVYRDLKPENVLLDHFGYVRLTDFGLSKENVTATDSGAHSFCGTPEYLAPEVLNRNGHGRAVDWWSLGALLYEMLTGLPPFYCRDRHKLFERIKRGKLGFPPDMSPAAKDLLHRLLNRNPVHRLGSGPGDAGDIKAHPFFRSVDWKALLECRVQPPWRPPVAGSTDTSQFDTEFTEMPLHSPGSMRDQRITASIQARTNFEGFTFVAPSTFGTTAASIAQRARSDSGAAAVRARAHGANAAGKYQTIPEKNEHTAVSGMHFQRAEEADDNVPMESFQDTPMSISS